MDEKLKELYLAITQNRGEPLDHWEIAALLEVYGIRDVDAAEYGFANVFELAKALEKYKDIKEYPKVNLVQAQEIPPLRRRIVQNYLKGLAFAVPMFIQILFTLVFGFALWSNTSINVMQATLIAFGTFLAMIITGGIAQVIGRKGLYYIKMNEDILAAKVMENFFFAGLAVIIVSALFFTLFNQIFNVVDISFFYYFIAAFVTLAILFLIFSVYYVFEDYNTIVYFVLGGIALVFPLHYIFGMPFPSVQFVAIALLDIVAFYFMYKKIRALRKKSEAEGELLPRVSMLIYTLLPFFIYGLFYFIFLVLDRLIEWNTNALEQGIFIWFDVQYEVGLDMAMIVLILLMGFLEVVVYELLYRINEQVFEYPLHRYRDFNAYFRKFYAKMNGYYILFSLATFVVTLLLVLLLKATVSLDRFPFSGDSMLVFVVGAVAYMFLTHSLMNALILFSFSRQHVVTKAIVAATIVDFFVGMIASHMIYKHYAVFGLLAGSLLFWYMTYKFVKKMFDNMDYYYYSAY